MVSFFFRFLAFEFGMVRLQKGFFGFRPWIAQWFSTSTLCISNNGYYKPGGILHSSTLLCDTVPSEVRSNSIQPRTIRASFIPIVRQLLIFWNYQSCLAVMFIHCLARRIGNLFQFVSLNVRDVAMVTITR